MKKQVIYSSCICTVARFIYIFCDFTLTDEATEVTLSLFKIQTWWSRKERLETLYSENAIAQKKKHQPSISGLSEDINFINLFLGLLRVDLDQGTTPIPFAPPLRDVIDPKSNF